MRVLLMLLLAISSSAFAQERVDWITIKEDGRLCIKTGFLTLCAGCISTSFNLDGVRYETAGSGWEYRASASDAWAKMSGESASGSVCSLSSTPTTPGQYRPIIRLRVDGVVRTYTSSNVLTIAGTASEDEDEPDSEEDENESQTVVETTSWALIKDQVRRMQR